MRPLTVLAALLLKLIGAYIVLYSGFPAYERFAESRMGVRAPIDGDAVGLLYALAIVAALAATSALAGAYAGRRRRLLAAAATALLFAVAGVVAVAAWLRTDDEFQIGPRLVATQSYVKYPPFRAAEAFQDLLHQGAVYPFATDAVMTLLIVFAGTGRRAISTGGTSPAAS